MKQKTSFLFITIAISLTNCQPINQQISTTTSTENVIYQRLLSEYEFNRKVKLKKQKIYNITKKKKELSQIIEYDKDGKIKHEERYDISTYDTIITFLDYNYTEKQQVSEVIISYNHADMQTENHVYQYDETGLLTQIVMNKTVSKSTFYKKENGYESIATKSIYDENMDSVIWKQDYISHFDWNGNRIDFVLNDENKEAMRIEYRYNSKNKKIEEKEFFYGELTAITTFEYNRKGLVIKALIQSFPKKETFKDNFLPSEKPEMRVYEYEFY